MQSRAAKHTTDVYVQAGVSIQMKHLDPAHQPQQESLPAHLSLGGHSL